MLNIIDLHCDTLSQMVEKRVPLKSNCLHFDIDRARASGVIIQFFAMFVNPDKGERCLAKVLLQLNCFLSALEEHNNLIYQITNLSQISRAEENNKLGCLLHLEGGEALGSDPDLLYLLHRWGLRSMGLTWNPPNLLAGGVDSDPERAGLTDQGRQVLRIMEDLGMILDLSHIAPRSFFEALEFYSKPVMVTHANTYALCPYRRNLTDDQLKALAENGGLIGFTQVADFVHLEGNVKPEHFLDHISYAADLIGVEHLALGSDFDGADHIVLPGIEAYRDLPQLLAQRGFSNHEIGLILAGNAMRVLKQVIKP